nr:hypothetical protein CPGR_06065 [Mycolicibacter nonchromogenicus]
MRMGSSPTKIPNASTDPHTGKTLPVRFYRSPLFTLSVPAAVLLRCAKVRLPARTSHAQRLWWRGDFGPTSDR